MKRLKVLYFLDYEHEKLEKMWYDNLARAYGHNMAKIIKVLIGRNPKKDFRVKNPLVLPNLNIEGDSKTESRRQSFCYFNAKVNTAVDQFIKQNVCRRGMLLSRTIDYCQVLVNQKAQRPIEFCVRE